MGEGELDMSRIRELLRYPGLLGDTLDDVRPEVVQLIAALRDGIQRDDRARVGIQARICSRTKRFRSSGVSIGTSMHR